MAQTFNGSSMMVNARDAGIHKDPGGNKLGQGQMVRTDMKVGRNDVCPCKSGQKYKKCHGARKDADNKFHVQYATG